MTEEGSGTSNGVNYAYSFTSKSWFGSYECRVHRVFLDSPTKELFTREFHVGGHPWQLKLIHKDEGHLAAYLYSRNQSTLTVRFSFTIINHEKKRDDNCWGEIATLEPGRSWGCPKLASIATLKDRSSGYCYGDTFVIRLDMRLKLPENESHSYCADEKNGLYVWKLKDPLGMSPWEFRSEEFGIGNSNWQLKFYPGGEKKDTRHTSIFLRFLDRSSVRVRFRFTALSHTPGESDYSKELIYTFDESNRGYGYRTFLDTEVLNEDGSSFLENGWLTLVVRVSIDAQGRNVPSAAYTQVVRDSNQDPDCVVCLSKPQTSGMLHGNTTHRCVCLSCAKKLEARANLKCPICMEKVDRVIYKFF